MNIVDSKILTENGSEYLIKSEDSNSSSLIMIHEGARETFNLLNVVTCEIGSPAVFIVEHNGDSHVFNITTTRVLNII